MRVAAPGDTTIGFVGMGILGVPMSLNLLKAGYKVVVYNRSSEKCDPVVAAGATLASSPRECAQLATYTFSTLSGGEETLCPAICPPPRPALASAPPPAPPSAPLSASPFAPSLSRYLPCI